MMSPLAIDLFCGLGGWTEGLLAEGYDVVGFDIERHDYGTGGYPGQLVLQDVLAIHGKQFKNAAVIVASPPCQKYSYMAMPWKRAKALAVWYREQPARIAELNALFDACFRIQCQAIEAAKRFIPLIVENVRGAQPWVGRSAWNFGSYHLWGDIPALMPIPNRVRKFNPDGTGHPPGSWFAVADSKNRGSGSWFNVAHNTTSGVGQNPDGRKIQGQDWSRFTKTGEVSPHWRMEAHRDDPAGVKQRNGWFGKYKPTGQGSRNFSSNSVARARASAEIAKIPFPLARHIAKCFKESHR